MATKVTDKTTSIKRLNKRKKIGAGDSGLLSNKIRKIKLKPTNQ